MATKSKNNTFYDLGWINNEKVEVPGKPIQLVKQDPSGQLIINEEAINIIKSMEGNIAVCSVVGPYRSGKSFILNLLLNKQDGFELGATYQSCTRGIWLWDTPIKHKNKYGEFNFLLLDTEGLGAPDASAKLDNQIFVLSLLLSSMFVYNTKNVIDRNAIKQLAVMTYLSKFINSSIDSKPSNETEDKKSLIYNNPDFVWVLRDFFLKLNGKTPKEYLNSSLELEASGQNENETKEVNFIRESIRNSFKSLDCVCLPTPVDAGVNGKSIDDTLRYLDQINWEQLRPDFQEGITGLCKDIKLNIAPKSLFSLALSSSAYAKYIETVVKQLNTNQRVSLTESLTVSIKYASEKALEEAIALYNNQMNQFISEQGMPMRWELLDEINKEILDNSLKKLEQNLNGNNDITKPFLEQFFDKIYKYNLTNDGKKILVGGLYNEYRLENSKSIKRFNKTELNKLWKKFIEPTFFDENEMKKNDPTVAQKFEVEYDRLTKSYDTKAFAQIEPEKSEAFKEWYKEKDIVNVTKSMGNLSEQIKLKLQKEEQFVQQVAEKKRLANELQEAKKTYDTAITKMDEKMEKLMQQHNQQMIETQNAHQAAMDKMGDKMDQMMKDNLNQINSLTQQINNLANRPSRGGGGGGGRIFGKIGGIIDGKIGGIIDSFISLF